MMQQDGRLTLRLSVIYGCQHLSAFVAAKAWRQNESALDLNDSDSEHETNIGDEASDEDDPLYLRETESFQAGYDSSSDREGDDSQRQIDVAFSNTDFSLSTWSPKENNIRPGTEKAVAIHLDPGETITFLGQYDLWIKAGAITIYGATLRKGRTIHRVFAPSTSALPQIKAICASEIEIWQCNHTLRHLGALSPLFRRIWSTRAKPNNTEPTKPVIDRRCFTFLSQSSDDALKRFLQPLSAHPHWQTVQGIICNSQHDQVAKVVVCGPKGSGKSTFVRLLTNRLVTGPMAPELESMPHLHKPVTVCILDLDPGQPDFSPPGQLSLVHIRNPVLGPPFTHPHTGDNTSTRLVRAHSIGAISPKDDPEYFLTCAADLIAHYQALLKNYPTCPLIINCPGYVLGSALEIMTRLLEATSTTDIVYMSQAGPGEVVHALRSKSGKSRFHELPSQPCGLTTRTPADFRAMQYLSYFHQDTPVHGNLRWNSNSINTRRSICLDYSHETSDILGILSLGEHPAADFLHTVLEGCLVSVCIVENESAAAAALLDVLRTPTHDLPYWPHDESGLTTPFSPSHSHMVGLAWITRVDIEKHQLRLQTPISPIVLDQILVKSKLGDPKVYLIRGSLDTPGWAYQEQLHLAQHAEKRRRNDQLVAASDAENLTIDTRQLPANYDEVGSEADDSIAHAPWVKALKPGQGFEKRWRVRRDLGRPVRQQGLGNSISNGARSAQVAKA